MNRRSVPALLLVILGLAGLVVVGRDATAPQPAFFANTGGTWMPAVGTSGSLTGSWFCPGVPTSGLDDVGGSVVVSNRDAAQIVGRFQVLTENGVVADESFTVDSWSQATLDVDARVDDAPFASVVVEVEGGGGLVEQIAEHPLGDSVAACSNQTSANWYLADGFTLDSSNETLILSNPFDESVVADLRFSTEGRQSEPGLFEGFTVLPRSVRTISLGELARNEPIIATSIEARAGRLVVGRAQEYQGGGRFGFDVSLAAPELRDQWWFADGERADGIEETYSIYNPTDEDVEVTVFFGGLPLAATGVNERDPVIVPARRVVVYDPYATVPSVDGVDGADGAGDDVVDEEADASGTSTDDGGDFVDFEGPSVDIPDGRHATVFSTLAQPSIVVERVITRPSDGSIATSTVLGAPPRPDGYVANTWHMGIGPAQPTEDALVVYNIDQIDATITVSVVGPDGPSVVPSLDQVTLTSGGITTIDLVDQDVLGRELIVTSTSRVFIERSLPRNNDLPGRSGSWLLPSSG